MATGEVPEQGLKGTGISFSFWTFGQMYDPSNVNSGGLLKALTLSGAAGDRPRGTRSG